MQPSQFVNIDLSLGHVREAGAGRTGGRFGCEARFGSHSADVVPLGLFVKRVVGRLALRLKLLLLFEPLPEVRP